MLPLIIIGIDKDFSNSRTYLAWSDISMIAGFNAVFGQTDPLHHESHLLVLTVVADFAGLQSLVGRLTIPISSA